MEGRWGEMGRGGGEGSGAGGGERWRGSRVEVEGRWGEVGEVGRGRERWGESCMQILSYC